jgi:hypothetical protein
LFDGPRWEDSADGSVDASLVRGLGAVEVRASVRKLSTREVDWVEDEAAVDIVRVVVVVRSAWEDSSVEDEFEVEIVEVVLLVASRDTSSRS